MRALLISLLICLPLFAQAEERVVLGLSQDEVAINATFDGSELLIFGAIKRDAPPPNSDLDVIIAVAGPDEPATVRHKERRFGIWMNTEAVEIDEAPTFYAVASSSPIVEILDDIEDLRNQISIRRAIRSVGATVEGAQDFTRALIRIRESEELYQLLPGAVDVEDQTLFRTRIQLPANLTEGAYETRIFLVREGKIIDIYDTTIPVNKVGLERWLYDLAQERAALYGIMALVIAISAGWLASAAFSLFRR